MQSDGDLQIFSLVMPGLDPGIHQSSKELFWMDGRVEPGHDKQSAV